MSPGNANLKKAREKTNVFGQYYRSFRDEPITVPLTCFKTLGQKFRTLAGELTPKPRDRNWHPIYKHRPMITGRATYLRSPGSESMALVLDSCHVYVPPVCKCRMSLFFLQPSTTSPTRASHSQANRSGQ